MNPQAPVGRLRPRLVSLLALLLLAAVAPPGAARAEEEGGGPAVDWLRDWIPSIAVTGGLASREVFGSIGGGVSDIQTDPNTGQIVRTENGQPGIVNHGIRTTGTQAVTTTCIKGDASRRQPDGSRNSDNDAVCEFFGEGTSDLDGFSVGGSAQLLGPALNPVPLRPRPLFHAGYLLPQSTRAPATAGFKTSDFGAPELGREPKVRLQLKADSASQWWVGGGVALQLPIRRYRTWLKLSAGYSEEVIDVTARADARLPGTVRTDDTKSLNIKSIVPTIGLEAEVAQFGPFSVSLSADTMIAVALNDETAVWGHDCPPGSPDPQMCPDPINADLLAPLNAAPRQPGPIDARFEPDDLHIFGGISIRLNWIGFER